MQEIAVDFENDGLRLFGMLHLPDGNAGHPCVVFLHDYTGNRIGDHCMLVKAARDFAAHGMAALRFDFRGSGESQGDFAEMTLEGEISDALAAVGLLEDFNEIDQDRIGLAGQSLGGSIAACVASQAGVKSVALWAVTAFVDYLVERAGEIVKDPYAWLPEDYREAIKKRGRVDIGGFSRGKPFFESMKRVDPLREIAGYQGPVLLIHGSEDEVVSPVNSELIYDSIKGRRRLIMIDDADHTFSSGQWERQVIEETRLWFEQTLFD
jgi:dipeptidyl aminopeptidase/acylaminoacyl peptidase